MSDALSRIKEADMTTSDGELNQMFNALIDENISNSVLPKQFAIEKIKALQQAKEVIRQNELNRKLVNKTNSLAIATWCLMIATWVLVLVTIFKQ